MNWIQLGDDNTQYFYAVIKHRKLQHAITQLLDRKNVVQHEPEKIAKILVEFYQNLLGKREVNGSSVEQKYIKNGYICLWQIK